VELTLNSKIRLNNGAEMPRLGLGVYQVPIGVITESVVSWALADGYRHVDTAKLYRNEASVGRAIRESVIPREDVWVTTKLWPTDFLNVRSAFDLSLSRLGLEYVDLYLIHFPVPGLISRVWKAMEAIASKGRARAIGVSNFGTKQLTHLLRNSTIPPSVNQVRASVFGYNKNVYELCQSENVVFEAYSPLRRGKDHDHPSITKVAAQYDKSPAQVMCDGPCRRTWSPSPSRSTKLGSPRTPTSSTSHFRSQTWHRSTPFLLDRRQIRRPSHSKASPVPLSSPLSPRTSVASGATFRLPLHARVATNATSMITRD
jgi:diketogulonate reductase-like aldo/keto reductase